MNKIAKKIIAIVFVCYCILAITGCHDNSENPLDGFNTLPNKILNGKEIKLNSDSILFRPFAFKVYDTLGVFDDNIGKTGLTVINLITGKLVRRVAYAGDKSAEFNLNALSLNNVINDKYAFTVLQLNPPCKVFDYKIGDLLKSPIYKPEPLYATEQYGYSSAILLNDSTIFGQISYSQFDNKLYGITRINSKKLVTGLDVPRTTDNDLQHYYNDSTFYKNLKIMLNFKLRHRPGSEHEFAAFSSLGAVIQIFSIDQNFHFKTKHEKVYYLPAFSLEKGANFTKPKLEHGKKFGFNDITVTKDRIYALFNGPKANKLNTFIDIVLVYDWNGKPIEKITLDRKCKNITIDENNPNILYGLYGEKGTHIVKYTIR